MPETAALQKPMTGFHLKLIALTTMFIDHIGAVFFPQVTLLRVIGRISFPLYAFLIAEGCRYTRNRGRYALGLGAFALISELPYDLALHPEFLENGLWGQNFLFQTNIFYTMFFAVAGIHIFEVLRRRSWKAQLAALGSFAGVCLLSVLLYNAGRSAHGGTWLLYASHLAALSYHPLLLWACCMLEKRSCEGEKPSILSNILSAGPPLLALLYASLYSASYAGLGVLLMFLLYLAKSRRAQAGVLTAWVLYYYGLQGVGQVLQGYLSLPYMLGRVALALAAAALVYFAYNGQRGKPVNKWIFYAAYPVHLGILAALGAVLNS